MRMLKLLVVVILVMMAGLMGYAYFGDMEPMRVETRQGISTGEAPASGQANPPASDGTATTNATANAPLPVAGEDATD